MNNKHNTEAKKQDKEYIFAKDALLFKNGSSAINNSSVITKKKKVYPDIMPINILKLITPIYLIVVLYYKNILKC